jgi:hypothetical protein
MTSKVEMRIEQHYTGDTVVYGCPGGPVDTVAIVLQYRNQLMLQPAADLRRQDERGSVIPLVAMVWCSSW